MPVAEKRIFRRWVLWAVKVIWEGLGWSEWYVPPQQQNRIRSGDYRTSPLVRCDWDEASCSQLVLLYNELTVKQHGDAHHLFRLMGKKRARYNDHPCVRIASIDIGGGTTDIAIFANDSIKHTHVLALGGQNLTNDIAFGLRTPIAAAERIKLKYGCALTDMVRHDEFIEVPTVGGRDPSRISRQILARRRAAAEDLLTTKLLGRPPEFEMILGQMEVISTMHGGYRDTPEWVSSDTMNQIYHYLLDGMHSPPVSSKRFIFF